MWPFSSKPDPEEWKQMRSEINSQVMSKLEDIERAVVAQHEQTHAEVMRRLEDINNRQNYIRQELLNKVQAQEDQTRSEIAEVYTHVQSVLAIMSQFSRPSLNGHSPIHERIKAHMQEATRAIERLGSEHAQWLVEQQQSIEAAQGQLRIAATHIFPEEEQVEG